MLFGFKQQFAPLIISERKRGTIRLPRKDGKRAKPGEVLHLYTGLRTKNTQLLGRPECAFCTEISISPTGFSHGDIKGIDLLHWIEADPKLAEMEIKAMFAYADGFDSWDAMLDYFQPTRMRPFEGVWTTWNKLNKENVK